MVPEKWTQKTLLDITKWSSGGTPSKNNPLFWGGDIPWISAISMRGHFFSDSALKVTELAASKTAKIAEKNNILLLVRGSMLWNKIPVGINTKKVSFNQDVKCITPNPKHIDNIYLLYWFISKENYLMGMVTGTGIGAGKLDTSDLQSMDILLPPLPEQKKIAQILSTWDRAITTTERLLANSQKQKKALMQQLLTGKKRLLDKSGIRFSGEWKDIRLKSVLREVKTRNKDNSIDRVLSVTNHSGFVLPEEQFSKRVASDNVSNYKVIKKGQYGYNPSRLNVGSFARLDSYDEGLLSPMYVVLSVNEKLLNSDYFMNWMGSNEAKQRISGSTQGSVRDSVGFDSLCGFPFKLPPMAEQQKIAAVLSTTDQEISALQQKLNALKQ